MSTNSQVGESYEKVPASNYEQAKKELETMDKSFAIDVAKELPSEIKKSDEGHFNVVLVRVEDLPGSRLRKGSIAIQQYDRLSLEKLKNGVTFMGYDAAVILHEPTVKQTVKSITEAKKQVEPVKSEAEIRAEVEAELDAKYQKKFQFVQNPHHADLSGMQDDDLKLFAEVNGIDLGKATKAEEMKVVISDWQLYTANPKEFPIEGLPEEELRKFASLNDIEVKKTAKLEDLTTAITTWQADNK